jgi:hypothetical protein
MPAGIVGLLPLLYYAVALAILYWVIRVAVRDAIQDADTRRDRQRPQPRSVTSHRRFDSTAVEEATLGYTHYWRSPDIRAEAWADLCADATSIIAQYERLDPEHPLAGPRGEGLPEATKQRIALNGRKPAESEPFVLRPTAGWTFCKTNWMPYDVAVCTILLRATIVIPAFEIDSDGEWQREWQDARNLYAAVFGHRPESEPFRDTTADVERA